MTAPKMDRATALKVCGMATDTDDARMLLEALGIWPVGPKFSVNPSSIKARVSLKVPIKRIPPECGTFAGFWRHKRASELTCADCNAARQRHRREHGYK